MRVHRVVTGQEADGRSVVVEDEQVEPVTVALFPGAEVLLGAGDCVVQNGARHRWRNPSSEPCVMAVAQIGAARRPSKD